jgi:hypothetical protein
MDLHRIDGREASRLRNMTPNLVLDNTELYDKLMQQFTKHAVNKVRAFYTLVLQKLSLGTDEVDA